MPYVCVEEFVALFIELLMSCYRNDAERERLSSRSYVREERTEFYPSLQEDRCQNRLAPTGSAILPLMKT